MLTINALFIIVHSVDYLTFGIDCSAVNLAERRNHEKASASVLASVSGTPLHARYANIIRYNVGISIRAEGHTPRFPILGRKSKSQPAQAHPSNEVFRAQL